MLEPDRINPNLKQLPVDFLYHLGLSTADDLRGQFGDVRFVCMGGSPVRAEAFAEAVAERFNLTVPGGIAPLGKTERYSLYKVGPVLSASHGIGMPSMLILLHEVTKLLHYAECREVVYLRIGTSGGLGLPAGSVVISQNVVNGQLRPEFEAVELGKKKTYPLEIDAGLVAELFAARGDLPAVLGTTMGTDDFYEGQARLDGVLPPGYDIQSQQTFLRHLHAAGVRNIEMEASAFAMFVHRAGIRGAVVCATLLDRLQGDQVSATAEELGQYSGRAQELVLRFIASKSK